MKVNKKFFICAMLVLMLFLCVNASSAVEPLNDTLKVDIADELAIDEVSNSSLGASGDTFVVDANGGGQYTSISDAVSAATGGETILIKNGEYIVDSTINFEKSVNIVGESKDGVYIKSSMPSSELFLSTTNDVTLSFSNLIIKDSSKTGGTGLIRLGTNVNADFIDCTFQNITNKYGVMQFSTTGTVNIENCQFNDIKCSASNGAAGVYTSAGTTINIKNTVFDNGQFTLNAGQVGGVVFMSSASSKLYMDNVTIQNFNGPANSVVRGSGIVDIRKSKIINNTVTLSSSGSVGESLFYISGSGQLTIEQTIIADNDIAKNVFYFASGASATVKYNNIYNNVHNSSYQAGYKTTAGTLNADYNYWGSNDVPSDVVTTNHVIKDASGNYILNTTGESLEKEIPEIVDEPTYAEGTIFVSPTGDDAKDGLTEDNAVATISHAIEIAQTGKIVLLEGTHTIDSVLMPTKDLDITGQGVAIVDGNNSRIIQTSAALNLTNIEFTNGYSKSSSLINIASDGTILSLDNVKFYGNIAKYGVAAQTTTKLIINNSKFYDNDFTTASNSVGIVYIYSADAIIENSEFKNNKGKDATAIAVLRASSASTGSLKMNNVIISDNSANVGNGILRITGTNTVVEVVNSKFINNYVNVSSNNIGGNGGAIYMAASQGTLTVNQSVFINNTGNNPNSLDTGIHANAGTVNIVNSILLGNATAENCVVNAGATKITAENNWWGNNEKANTKVDVNTIVTMDATMTPNPVRDGEQVTVTATFSNDKLPDNAIDVTFTSTSGNLNKAVSVVDGVATATYTIDATDDKITATSGDAQIEIDINRPYSGIIYVNTTGSDDNEGSIDAPVATVGKAVELALANGGSGQIIINEGTYVGNGYHVTGDLNVTGKGKVTLDANDEGRLFYMGYGETADKIALSNLILTNANGYGAAVYSFANELILDNVTIVNNQATGYLIASKGKLTIKDSEITNSTSGNVIEQSASGDILINNTLFKDNSVADTTSVYAVVYLSSGSGTLTIEDSKFINNTARQGVIKGNNNYNINVKGTEFINNTDTVSYGGAIYAYGDTLDVTGSTFINNKAYRDGGAIYVGWRTTATVDKSIFINNTAGTGSEGDAIYNGNKLSVNNSVLLTNATHHLIYNDGEDNVVNAQNNWWGTNDNPKDLVASGTYEDWDEEEYPCGEVDVSNWATMDASFTPANAYIGDEVTVTATFSNVNLPDGIEVTFTSTSGLNTVVSTVAAQASTTYTIAETDKAINATSTKAVVEMPIVDPFATNIVTQDNFYNFFDDAGILKDTVPFDELIFKGSFSDLAAGYVILTKPVAITGDEAVLNNMGIVVSSQDVSLTNLTFTADTALGDLVYVEGNNVNMTNLNITYIVGDEAARAISIIGASDVNVNNANITFESHVTDSSVDGCAINIEDAENVAVTGSEINSSLPALLVNYNDYSTQFMGLNQVNPIRIVGSKKVNVTKNIINSKTNDYSQQYATIQAMLILESHDCLVDSNNITLTDEFAQEGQDIYLYGISFAYDEGLVMSNNNFTVHTNGGMEAAGTAYAIQGIESELSIIGNNITTFSNGPNLGIYVTSMLGESSIMLIENNTINVTGLAAAGNTWALVSGIEIQNGEAKIYNNTVYTYNTDEYDENDYLSGISYVQYMYGGRTFDIQNNTVYTEGKYAIYLLDASNSIITGNELYAHDLKGSDAVYIQTGENNVIEDNRPTNVVTNDTFYDFFDEKGLLLDTITFDELIFKGEFSDLVKYITLERSIVITGEDAVLNDIAFIIAGEGVTLDSLNLVANSDLGNLIDIAGQNAVIVNNNITYVVTKAASAINVYPAANGAQILNNDIRFESTVEEYSTDDITAVIAVSSGISLMDDEADPITGLVIDGNNITAVIPAFLADVYENEYYVMGLSAVNGVRINGAEEFEFKNNNLNVTTNRLDRTTPTYQALYVASSSGLVDGNNITMIDTFTPEGKDVYLHAMELINDEGLTISNNNFNMSTAGGKENAGSAYAIVAIASEFGVISNNITTVSNGPNLAIFFPSRMGAPCDVEINGNFMNVTGLASDDKNGLVSAIEVQTGNVVIKENEIYTYNVGEFNESNNIYGISYVQDGVNSDFEITNNTINTEGKYAVSLKSANDATITNNTLYAHDLKGDKAVFIGSGDGNIVEDNLPEPVFAEIAIEANTVWTGSNSTVVVTVANATGKVTIKVNDKEFDADELDENHTATKEISSEDLVSGINNITVTYEGPEFETTTVNGVLYVADGVVTQDTYEYYFNQDNAGRLFDYVPEGTTLDFQGSIINPDQANVVQINVNKPVNIVSTTGDAYIDLNTTAGSLFGDSPGNSFAVTRGGSGSNITGIKLHNTQLWISNTTDVVLDNISVVVENQRVGSGVGATTIRDNSSNVVLKNSYLYTKNNGRSTTFTMSWASNCTIDNCTVKAEGDVGNLIYLNTFNIVGAPSDVPLNNYNKVINNRIYGKEGSSTSIGLMVEGQNNLIENNTFYKASSSNSFGAKNPYNNTYIGNTMADGGSLTAQAGSIIYNNNVSGSLSIGKESTAYNNTVSKSMTVPEGAVAYNNTVGTTVSISGKNAVVENNTIAGAVTIAKAATNTTFVGNKVNATVTVNSNNNRIEDNNITSAGTYAVDLKSTTGNNVTGNYLIAGTYKGAKAVSSADLSNVVENNMPALDITVVADSVWIGSNGTVVIKVVNVTGNVTLKVNEKEFNVELDENGTATKEISAEDLVLGANNITVTYENDEYIATNNTVLAVIDGVITNETYAYYFDKSGNLVSVVHDGATLDFQGLFLGKFPVYINKNVNVITSTGDALFDAGDSFAGNSVNSFNIVAGGDNTNITGLKFINNCLYIKGASNVTVDEISIVANKRGVGSGTGFLSIHTGANNTIVKNSYFENGGTGSSLLVLGKGGAYATFDHNVFNITGSSGNILSASQFVGQGASPEHVSYTNNVLYNNQPGSPFCYAMTVSGSGNLIENNTIYHNGSGILNQYGASSTGNVYRNNTVYGSANFNPSANSIVENNKIQGTTNIAANTVAVGNTFSNVVISGTNTTFADNNVTGTVTVSGNNNRIENNTIISTGNYAVDLRSTTGNNVTGNYLVANENYGQDAVNAANKDAVIIEDNKPYDPELIIKVDDIAVGEDAIINVTANENVSGVATVIVNGKTYTVDVNNGFGTVTVSDLTPSDYTVTATLESSVHDYGGSENSTVFNVAKLESEVNITISDAVLGNDTAITVSIPGATGNVTIIVNGKEEVISLDENGNATYTVEDIAAGDYNVVAIYSGDKDHGFAYATDSFTVDKQACEVNVTVTAGKAGEKSTVKVNVTEGATGTVIIDVNGTKYVIDLAETTELELALDAGEYPVVASYSGDDKYNASVSGEETIVVDDKKDANIEIAIPDDIKVGDKIIINITADTDANLTVTINGVPQEIVSGNGILGVSLKDLLRAIENGKVVYTVPGAGVYNITVTAKETEEYIGTTVTKIFEVTKKDAVLDITPITDAKIGDKVTIAVVNETDGALTIKVNGEEVSGDYEITKEGTYTVTVESAATDSYNAGFATYTFEAAGPANITIIIDGVEYTIPDVNGTAVDTGLPEELEKAKQNITNLTEQLDDANAKVDDLTGELADANAKVDNLTGELADANAKVDNLTGELADANAKVDNLTGELADANAKVDNLTGELADANAKVDDLTGELADATAKVDNLTEQLDDANAKVDDLTGELADATAKVDNLTEQLDDANAKVDDLTGELADATAKVDNLTEQLNDANAKVDNLTGELADANAKVDNLTGELADAVANATKLADDLADANAKVDNLTGELADANAKIADLTRQLEEALANKTKSVVVDGVEYPIEYVNGTAIVNTNKTETVASEFTNITVFGSNIEAVLVDSEGKPISGAAIAYKVNGVEMTTTTDDSGKFMLNITPKSIVEFAYAGNETVLPVNLSINLQGMAPVRQATIISGNNFTQYALDYNSGERGQNFTVKLTDANGNILVNKTVLIGYNGKILTRVTNATGHASVQINLRDKNRLTFAVTFLGDDDYNATMSVYLITIVQKPVTITAPAKTYKATAKTKKYTVSLSTILGSSCDGKIYFGAGKKVTMKVNGKTYTAKTNAKGQATFSLKITKKGKYTASIKYAGDTTYKATSKSAKITIK